MDTENSETTMWVVRCSNDHPVAWNGSKYWCKECQREFAEDEIVMTPIKKRNPPSVRPTVYGHPN